MLHFTQKGSSDITGSSMFTYLFTFFLTWKVLRDLNLDLNLESVAVFKFGFEFELKLNLNWNFEVFFKKMVRFPLIT